MKIEAYLSEAKFSVLFAKAAFAIALSRLPDGAIVEVNEEFKRTFGYSRQEVMGKTSVDLGIYSAEIPERLLAEFEAHGAVRQRELTLRAKSGEQRVMSVSSDLVEIGGQQYILITGHHRAQAGGSRPRALAGIAAAQRDDGGDGHACFRRRARGAQPALRHLRHARCV